MKKRIHYLVALVLALTLVFAMAVTVSATEAEPQAHADHCVCGGELQGHAHEVLTWTPWGDEEAELTKLPSAAGNYYLTADIDLSGGWYVTGKTINLCLNGHIVTGSGGSNQTIMMGNTADNASETSISKLVITDCRGTGLIQSDANQRGGVLRFRNDPYATVEIYGGELKSTVTEGTQEGGAVYMDGGNLYLYGGTVTGGDSVYASGTGANTNGGAVFLTNAAKFYMYGGTVNGGTDYSRGAGVAVRHADAAFYMYGGTIQGGSSNYGDAIHCNNGTVWVEAGTLDVYSGNNLHKAGSGTITVKTAIMPKGMNVNTGKISEWLAEGSYVMYKGSYHEGNTGALEGEVMICNHSHCVCAGTVSGHECQSVAWIAWTSKTALPNADGYYYLTGDVTLTQRWEIKNKNIKLCLNGHTVTGAGGSEQTIMMGSTSEADAALPCKLTVTDCNAQAGAIVSASNINGAIVRTRAYGDIVIDLYNGTLDATCEAAANEGGAVALNSGVFNMYGGTLSGYATAHDGKTGKNGGTVAVNGSKSEFNQYGGTVTGGSVAGNESYGGNIFVNGGKVNLYGGSVTGGTAEYGAGNIYVKSGTFTLDGGTVSGGKVTGGGRMGGNLWVNGGTANLISGTVSAGEAPHGGNLRLTGGTINLSGANVTGGIAGSNGGNLSMIGGTFNMTGGTVTLGNANSSGGNLYINAGGAQCYLNGGTVSDGTAQMGDGGNIYFSQGGSMGAVTVIGGTADRYGGSICVAEGKTVTVNGADIRSGSDAVTAKSGGVIHSMGILTITDSTISGGYAGNSPSGGTVAIAGGTASITDSTLTAGWGSRGTCVNVSGTGSLTVTDSQISGCTQMNENANSYGTCFWIEGDGTVKLVGNVVITGEGLDMVRDLRTGTTTIDLSELAIVGDEKISLKMQTNGEGQAAYAGTNENVMNMVEAYLAPYQKLNYNAESGWIELAVPALVGFDAQNTPYAFESWEEAMAEELSRIVVYRAVSGTVSKDIVLDLNGIALTDMVVGSGVTVRLIDTQTDDYTGTYGSLSGTVNGNVEAFVTYGGKTYVVVCEDNAYSAHRYDVKLTYITLKANEDALGYKAALYGDETVMKYVTDFGFELWLDDGSVVTRSKTGTQNLTLRLAGIMENGGGETNVNAKAFVTLNVSGQESTKTTDTHATSMKSVILTINNTWTKYTDTQKETVKALYECYSAVMDTWFDEGVTNNIKAYEGTEA